MTLTTEIRPDTAPAAVPVMFARPAEMPAWMLALANAMWTGPWLEEFPDADDTDLLATLLGLGPGDGHDELTCCEVCGCWFWADNGATVRYESGADLTMCDDHAVADDPGAVVYAGPGLEALWRDQDAAAARARMLATGSAW